MEAIDLQKQFVSKITEEIRIKPQGNDYFRISTPFMFSDGDHFSIAIRKEGKRWIFTDEGDTFMHLSILGVKPETLTHGTREKILSGILEEFSIKYHFGELILEIQEENYGSAFYCFTQALLKISDLTYLNRDTVEATFLEDFKDLITEAVDIERCSFNWNNTRFDKDAKYTVDCRVNSMEKPLMIFAVQNEQKALISIITINQLEKWKIPFFPIGIFKNMEKVGSKTISKFSDVCNKTYSNIDDNENRTRAINYLRELTSQNNW
jgi:hypothetical protein